MSQNVLLIFPPSLKNAKIIHSGGPREEKQGLAKGR